MLKKRNARSFAIAAAVGLSVAIVAGITVGQLGNSGTAIAEDHLPAGLAPEDIGDGGVDTSTVRTIAESREFQVWEARDRSDNICIIAEAPSTGDTASYCGSEDHLKERGLSGWLQVGAADQGDTSITVLQTYLLPEGADVEWAAEHVAGSRTFGQLIVSYGAIDREQTTTIAVPAKNGEVLLQVFGRDSF